MSTAAVFVQISVSELISATVPSLRPRFSGHERWTNRDHIKNKIEINSEYSSRFLVIDACEDISLGCELYLPIGVLVFQKKKVIGS